MPWSEITRHQYEVRSRWYASDSTDREWALVAPFLSVRKRIGRPLHGGIFTEPKPPRARRRLVPSASRSVLECCSVLTSASLIQ